MAMCLSVHSIKGIINGITVGHDDGKQYKQHAHTLITFIRISAGAAPPPSPPPLDQLQLGTDCSGLLLYWLVTVSSDRHLPLHKWMRMNYY